MSEIRRDPVTGGEVVLAPRRILPPPAFGPGTPPEVASCPFCPGFEAQTGPELGRRPEHPWQARAFPNRRPGLNLEAAPVLPAGRYWRTGARGAHEVIVIGPDHAGPTLEDRHHGLMLAAERMADLARDPGFAALGWLRNRGVEAGATQPHAHAQIVASPIVPARLRRFVDVQLADPHLLPAVVARAREDGRLVAERDGVVAYCPWAPLTPFEVRFQPEDPIPTWYDDPRCLEALAALIHVLVDALDAMGGWTALNLVGLFGPPGAKPPLRWQVRLLPRLVPVDGFAMWSGGAMHPILPESAAQHLRDTLRRRSFAADARPA